MDTKLLKLYFYIEKQIKWDFTYQIPTLGIHNSIIEDDINELFDTINEYIYLRNYKQTIDSFITLIEILKLNNLIDNKDIIYIYKYIVSLKF